MEKLIVIWLALVISGFFAFDIQHRPTRSLPDRVVEISLNRDEATIWCTCKDASDEQRRRAKESLRIAVSAKVRDQPETPFTYTYFVSGGKIEGQGTHVFWDLDNVAPGKYTISAHADDGVGFRDASVEKSIELREADCHCPCHCPLIRVAPNYVSIRRGQNIVFEAIVSGLDAENLAYNWNVLNGTILKGSGTTRIVVKTDTKTKGQSVTANLTVSGLDPTFNCPIATSNAVKIGSKAIPQPPIANIQSLELDEKELFIDCSPGSLPEEDSPSSEDMIVDAWTITETNRALDKQDYQYKISGGTLIGEGSHVRWDLSGVSPGSYDITATLTSPHPSRSTEIRKTVTVLPRRCSGDLDCPELKLSGPKKTDLSGDFIVKVSLAGGSYYRASYAWSVTNGELIAGNGTEHVRVRSFADLMGPGSVLTVKIGGLDQYGLCPSTESILISKTPE